MGSVPCGNQRHIACAGILFCYPLVVIRINTSFCNNSYYASGYSKGYQQAIDGTNITYTYHEHLDSNGKVSTASYQTIAGGCYTEPVYHSHSGNPQSYGGCYTAIDTSVSYSHTSTTYHAPDGVTGDGKSPYWTCDSCGIVCGMDGHSYTQYKLNCGKSSSTIEKYKLGCGKTTDSIESAVITFE